MRLCTAKLNIFGPHCVYCYEQIPESLKRKNKDFSSEVFHHKSGNKETKQIFVCNKQIRRTIQKEKYHRIFLILFLVWLPHYSCNTLFTLKKKKRNRN